MNSKMSPSLREEKNIDDLLDEVAEAEWLAGEGFWGEADEDDSISLAALKRQLEGDPARAGTARSRRK